MEPYTPPPILSDSSDYDAVFQPLISLTHNSDILEAFSFEKPAITGSSSQYSLFFGMWQTKQTSAESKDEYNKRLAKLFREKIQKINDSIDHHLEEVRYNPDALQKLKSSAEKVYKEGKTILLRDKLEKENLCPEKTKEKIIRLEKLLIRTITTPPIPRGISGRSVPASRIGSPHLPAPYLPMFYPHFPLRFFSLQAAISSNSLASSQQEFDAEDLQKMRNTERENLTTLQLAMEVLLYNRNWGDGWEKRLIESVKKVSDDKVLQEIGSRIKTIEMLTLADWLSDDTSESWKLVPLLGALQHEIFVDMVFSCEQETLIKLNKQLLVAPTESLKWFQEAFLKQRDCFVKYCNADKDYIDRLAESFREDLEGHHITHSDLQPIQELRDSITLKMKMIQEHLEPLLRGVIKHPETRHVILEGTIKEYKTLLVRLTETGNPDTRPAGCLLPIIYRNVFERAEVEDNEEAFEIFADWSITFKEEYRAVGLFGTISDETFNQMKEKLNCFTLAKTNLQKLGISVIADWKKIPVFNRNMLQSFLSKEDICIKLTNWTKEALQ